MKPPSLMGRPTNRPPGLDPYQLIFDDIETFSIDSDTEEWQKIEKYFDQTQGEKPLPVQLVDIIEIKKPNEPAFEFPGEKTLLWHGTTKSNLPLIINDGLMINPHAAVFRAGGILGKGVYFSDSFAKSASYSVRTNRGAENYILLCEVFLGKTFSSTNFFDLKNKEKILGHDSIKAIGKITSLASDNDDLNGVQVPSMLQQRESSTENSRLHYQLEFNEYVVFDEKRIKPKYLVRFLNTNMSS